MITYATYHASNPLPAFPPPRILHAVEPPTIGRMHRIADHEEDNAQRVISSAELLEALSKTEWRGAAMIAEKLKCAASTVCTKMAEYEIAEVTELRRVGRGGKYEWRLK